MSATRPPTFDDRLTTQSEASRRGAHRARPKPVSAGLPVLAGIAVVLLVLGGGYVMLKGNGSGDSNSNLAAASPGVDEPVPTGPASAAPTPTEAEQTEQTEPSTEPTATETKAAAVDKDVEVKVLNSTSVRGLAGQVADTMNGAGWTVPDSAVGDSRNRNLPVTRVYYGRAATKATAQALVKELGFGTAVRNADALAVSDVPLSGLVVVVGLDADT
jgi:hypothetical protein